MIKCKRCETQIAGKGWTGLCKACVAHFMGTKTGYARMKSYALSRRKRSIEPEQQLKRFNARGGGAEPSLPRLKFLEKEADE